MLQLNPTIDVLTPKGKAEAIVIIDYGVNVNSVWLCRMQGGKVLHFYSDDIRVYDNPMNGNGWDVVPDFEKTQEDEEPPSGEDDIVLDFSKEPQPKTTIGAIDAEDLANTYAKLQNKTTTPVEEKNCICNSCKKEGKQDVSIRAFYPIVYRLRNGEIPHKGLEYAAGGWYFGFDCSDCFLAKANRNFEEKVIVSEPNLIKEDGSSRNKKKWWDNFPFSLPLMGK
jgi:hypothetical protein